MPYKHENTNKTIVQSYHAYSGDRAEAMLEIEEVYKKSKVFDEIETAYWKSNTPDNFAYEFVKIFNKHFDKDLERDSNGR